MINEVRTDYDLFCRKLMYFAFGCSLCVIIVLLVACSLGSLCMLVLGCVCLGTDNYDVCGSQTGAIILTVLGGVSVLGSICGGLKSRQ